MTSPRSAALASESPALSLPFSQEPGTPVANKERGLRVGDHVTVVWESMNMGYPMLGRTGVIRSVTHYHPLSYDVTLDEPLDSRKCIWFYRRELCLSRSLGKRGN